MTLWNLYSRLSTIDSLLMSTPNVSCKFPATPEPAPPYVGGKYALRRLNGLRLQSTCRSKMLALIL